MPSANIRIHLNLHTDGFKHSSSDLGNMVTLGHHISQESFVFDTG